MKKVLVWMAVVSILGLMAACGTGGDDDTDQIAERNAALRVMVDIERSADVTAAEMSIVSCDGSREVESRQATIDQWVHEVMTPSYVDAQEHLFFEHYVDVPAGCYDVEVAPLNSAGQPSETCSRAVGKQIDVRPEHTAEVLLFSRCDGVEEGPTIEMLEFDPTAFVGCEATVNVCATVQYVGDAKVSWAHHGGMPLPELPGVHETTVEKDGQRKVHCARWSPHYHGETVGRTTATPKWAESIDGGEEVLFADKHQVLFSLYAECPDREFENRQ